jgi:hypothetical protein
MMTSFQGSKPLPGSVVAAILTALDDEHHAEAAYEAVLARFGAVRPFLNIVEAERRHAAALIRILAAHGLSAPPNPYLSGAKKLGEVPATLDEACEAGVEAEIANVALYDSSLLPAVAGHPEVETVFRRLRDASAERHLPAFRRCASRHRAGPGALQ